MTIHKEPRFENPITPSIYFNYAAFLSGGSVPGYLDMCGSIWDVFDVLTGKPNMYFSSSISEFFATRRSIVAIAADKKFGDPDHLRVFQAQNGKDLLMLPNVIFPQSQPDIRFAIEDNEEAVMVSAKAGRTVIAVCENESEVHEKNLLCELMHRAGASIIVDKLWDVPEVLKNAIDEKYPLTPELKI